MQRTLHVSHSCRLALLSVGLIGLITVMLASCCAYAASTLAAGSLDWGVPLHIDHKEPYDYFNGVSCIPTAACVAVNNDGDIATTSNAGAGASAQWQVFNVTGNDPLDSVSCTPTGQLCVAGATEGQLATSTDPLGGPQAWTLTAIDSDALLHGISCPTMEFCAAAALNGDVVTSTDPTGGTSAWSVADIDGSREIYAISCPSETLCVAVDDRGNVLSSTSPTSGDSAWHLAHLTSGELGGVSCASISSCVAVGGLGEAFITSNPSGGASAWRTRVKLDSGAALFTGISCMPGPLCVAINAFGQSFESTDPYDGAIRWSTTEVEPLDSVSGDYLYSVSCASTSLCVAGSDGSVIVGQSGGVQESSASSQPVPILGQREGASVVSGKVSIRIKGTARFLPLSASAVIPDGSEVNATNGRVRITVATPSGHMVGAEAYAGRFLLHQDRAHNGETNFVLSLPLNGCPRGPLLDERASSVATSATRRSGSRSRHLWVSEHGGNWGTTGRYVSTTVEGTRWLTIDECSRSEVKVAAGKVLVEDLLRRRAKTLTAGQHYIASLLTLRMRGA